jgi:hypothetical protein
MNTNHKDEKKKLLASISVHSRRKGEVEMPPHLLTLERAGLVRIGKTNLPPGFWSLPRPKVRKGASLMVLLKEREEGR